MTPLISTSPTTTPRPRRAARDWRAPAIATLRVLAWVLGLPLAIVLVAIAVHSAQSEPRDAAALVQRELSLTVLEPGEVVRSRVPVLRRQATDYFRATRGVLLLTDRRIVYVGLVPRDFVSPVREPDVFEQADFPIDTSVVVTPGRTLFGTRRAVVLASAERREELVVEDGHWPEARLLMNLVEERQTAQREAARIREEARRAAEEAARQPRYHLVQRGEALSLIARRYGITGDSLRQLNGLIDDRIRAGDTLLVKPRT